MGYETKMYFVDPCRCEDTEGRIYASVVAMVDLCKMGGDSHMDVLRLKAAKEQKNSPTPLYIYSEDGNTKIVEDGYGEPLVELDPLKVHEALGKDIAHEPYRRFTLAALMLADFITNFEGGRILTFGY